jgi:hypothetical protein
VSSTQAAAGSRAIRWSTVAAVTGVALVAAIVSYRHAYAVVSSHGETGMVARLYPLTIDGLIYAASMALLDAARRSAPAPALARWLLAAGITATLAVNVAAGSAFGPLGAIVAAWPALALVGSYELLMVIIRGTGRQASLAAPAMAPGRVAADAESAARAALAASIAAGNPVSQRQLAKRFGISRARAAIMARELAPASSTSHTASVRQAEYGRGEHRAASSHVTPSITAAHGQPSLRRPRAAPRQAASASMPG